MEHSPSPRRAAWPCQVSATLGRQSWEMLAAMCDLAVSPPGRAEAAESSAGAGRVSPGTNLPGRVVPRVQSPTRTPSIPSGLRILGTAIAQGLWH